MPPIILEASIAILACVQCQKSFPVEVDPQTRKIRLAKILQHMDACFRGIGGLMNAGMIRKIRN
jgi:hypothetical protein